ncbi:ABC transporter ATP-binding protein [Pengzhenrongella frigida]|uniref:ABC transporter ATP-binding protein n=1 Tax=Pengzhenrongella frigida TaxID=1259133 RepID=A0A4Q5MUS7_9MICO|nr:ABC transporter ATP-binding protein [Cellulomonas sp. HLT2-17]
MVVVRDARRAWGRVSPFFAGSRWQIALLACVSVVAGFAEAALLALVAAIAGALSQGSDSVAVDLGPVDVSAGLGVLFGLGFTLAIVRGVLQLVLAYLPAKMSANAMAGLRRRLFDVYTAASWPVKAVERDGHFQSLMNAHVTSACQAIVALATGISVSLMFATMLVSAFVLSVPTAVVLVVTSGLLFLMLRPLAKRLRRSAKALSEENIEYSKGMQEVVLLAEETQVFGATDWYRERFYRLIDEVRLPLLRTRFMAKAVPALYQSVALVMLMVALVVVSFAGAGRIAALGAVVLILVRSLTYGQQIQGSISAMDELLPFLHRVGDAITHYGANAQQDGSQPLPAIAGLAMKDVSFGYVPGATVLEAVTFEVAMGEAIGIVGPSGAGKSSLVQLLLRLRDPEQGALLINGVDAREVRRSEWRRRVAYVPQTPQLLWGTVADNIRFYRPHLSDRQVQDAARRAHIHDEIMSWPAGYDTVVGQRASAVSGGQRQRLCLARALAEGPDVLILDEPTSALDVRSEAAVQKSLESLKGEVLLFLVAHRLTTVSICDRVMVIVDGRLQALDRPAQLLIDNDFYREVNEITRRQPRS